MNSQKCFQLCCHVLPRRLALDQLLHGGTHSWLAQAAKGGVLPAQKMEVKLLRRKGAKIQGPSGSGEHGHTLPKSSLNSVPACDNCVPKSDAIGASSLSFKCRSFAHEQPLRILPNREAELKAHQIQEGRIIQQALASGDPDHCLRQRAGSRDPSDAQRPASSSPQPFHDPKPCSGGRRPQEHDWETLLSFRPLPAPPTERVSGPVSIGQPPFLGCGS